MNRPTVPSASRIPLSISSGGRLMKFVEIEEISFSNSRRCRSELVLEAKHGILTNAQRRRPRRLFRRRPGGGFCAAGAGLPPAEQPARLPALHAPLPRLDLHPDLAGLMPQRLAL